MSLQRTTAPIASLNRIPNTIIPQSQVQKINYLNDQANDQDLDQQVEAIDRIQARIKNSMNNHMITQLKKNMISEDSIMKSRIEKIREKINQISQEIENLVQPYDDSNYQYDQNEADKAMNNQKYEHIKNIVMTNPDSILNSFNNWISGFKTNKIELNKKCNAMKFSTPSNYNSISGTVFKDGIKLNRFYRRDNLELTINPIKRTFEKYRGFDYVKINSEALNQYVVYQELKKLNDPFFLPVVDVFECNNYAYAEYDTQDGKPLISYMLNNMQWKDIKKIPRPLFYQTLIQKSKSQRFVDLMLVHLNVRLVSSLFRAFNQVGFVDMNISLDKILQTTKEEESGNKLLIKGIVYNLPPLLKNFHIADYSDCRVEIDNTIVTSGDPYSMRDSLYQWFIRGPFPVLPPYLEDKIILILEKMDSGFYGSDIDKLKEEILFTLIQPFV